MSNLKKKTVVGILWGSLERFSTLFIQLVCTLIIARFLSPSDFGLVGILTVFTALGTVITDAGFSQALIRKQDTSDLDYSSVFYFNVLLSLLLYSVLFLITPKIALFYNIKGLENAAKVIFLILPINAFSIIQQTILQKTIDYKSLSKISIISALVSGGLGVFLSYILKDVWALVFQLLMYNVFRTSLFWIFGKWRPTFNFSIKPIKSMSSFSLNLLLSGAIGVIFDNLYSIMIGKYYKPVDLGLYSQSKKISDIPTITIVSVIQQVTFASLSVLQNDKQELKKKYLQIIRLSVFIVTPLLSMLMITANDLFEIILGEKWKGAVIYFQLLCLIGMFYPISSINLNILKIVGKSNVLLRLEIAKKVLLVIILMFTIKLSLLMVIYGNFVYAIITVLLNMFFCGREINLGVFKQIADIFPIYLLSLIISIVLLYFYKIYLNDYLHLKIILSMITFSTLWIVTSYLLKFKVFKDLINIVK
ncbi:lipopolysaccharide biosynthesis protein [Emticicia sp. SJ17W-69]|uniref:lipopolysaccharide biosynthesis protein n=1 Tax=Emticicia sp. SJ17W-69 TaxID=3421657 RepID=UPI003EBECA04